MDVAQTSSVHLARRAAVRVCRLVGTKGAGLATCALITCVPNARVAPVHDRMPVILASGALDLWLGADQLSKEDADAILRPYAASEMRAQRASTRLNNVRYDAPDVLHDDDPVQESLL
jgi:putative SOS response-associated peptidase YedK